MQLIKLILIFIRLLILYYKEQYINNILGLFLFKYKIIIELFFNIIKLIY